MKQKITKYLIALVAALPLTPTLASAQTYTDTSAHLKYTLSGTNATITGPEAGYTTGTLNIPAIVTDGTNTGTVVAIGSSAFSGRSGFTGNLTIPNSVTNIGINAFYGCSGLTGNLIIPNNVTSIGDYAFYNCSSLRGNLVIPDGVTTIWAGAFYGCSGLTGDVVIPSTVTSVGRSAFYNCSSLRSLTFTSPTITVGNSLARGCTSLEYIDMSASSFATAMPMPTSFSRNVQTNNPFYYTSAHTVIYLPKNTNTALIPVSTDNENYVLNGKCDWFYVQDGVDYYIPKAFTATKATWNVAGTGAETTPNATRTNFGKLVTTYLPFDFTLPASSGLQGFTMFDKKNEPEHVFRFKQQAATVTFNANTPYILRNASGAAITFPEATGTIDVPQTPISRIVYAADGVTTSYDGGVRAVDNTAGGTISDPVKGTWGFYGTTERVSNNTAVGWKALILSGGAWYDLLTDVASPLSPLRAFLATSNGAVGTKPSFTLEDLNGNLIGGTNGIDEIDNEPTNSVETHIYNLNGQYLGKDINTLPKGLYIVNGKKVIK